MRVSLTLKCVQNNRASQPRYSGDSKSKPFCRHWLAPSRLLLVDYLTQPTTPAALISSPGLAVQVRAACSFS